MIDQQGETVSAPWDRFEDTALELVEKGLWELHRFEIERKRHTETKATWLLTGAAIAVTLLTGSIGLIVGLSKDLERFAVLAGPCALFAVFGVFAVSIIVAYVALLSACWHAIQVQMAIDISQIDPRRIENHLAGTARAVRLKYISALSTCIGSNDHSVSKRIDKLILAQQSLKVGLFFIAVLGVFLIAAVSWMVVARIGSGV